MDVQPNTEDAPTVDVDDMDNLDDTSHFQDEANDDLEVEWTGEDLHDAVDEHMVTPLIDVLQTLGVNVVDAVAMALLSLRIVRYYRRPLARTITQLSSKCMAKEIL